MVLSLIAKDLSNIPINNTRVCFVQGFQGLLLELWSIAPNRTNLEDHASLQLDADDQVVLTTQLADPDIAADVLDQRLYSELLDLALLFCHRWQATLHGAGRLQCLIPALYRQKAIAPSRMFVPLWHPQTPLKVQKGPHKKRSHAPVVFSYIPCGFAAYTSGRCFLVIKANYRSYILKMLRAM